MILVILGTQDKSFERLLKAVDRVVDKGILNDKIVVQAGYTKYYSPHMEIFDLIPIKEFNKLVSEADLIITHGGVGSIMQGLKKKKKIIATPRLAKYGEHTNDHQKQIIGEFVKEGYILECKNLNHLEDTILKLNDFKPKMYKSNNKKMINIITDFIDEIR